MIAPADEKFRDQVTPERHFSVSVRAGMCYNRLTGPCPEFLCERTIVMKKIMLFSSEL